MIDAILAQLQLLNDNPSMGGQNNSDKGVFGSGSMDKKDNEFKDKE